MKKITKIIFTFSISISLFACKKSIEAVSFDGGSINVTNAVVGGSTLNMMTSNGVVSASNTISVNNYAIMPVASGQQALNFGTPAVAATPTAIAKPAVVYYTQNVTVDNTNRYSLFLTGTSPIAIDNVLIKESYIQTYKDSVCGVRFINLSPGSNPISINLQGHSTGSEAVGLAYKAYSDFKQYPAKSVNPSYTFEFRDTGTGNLIKSYTLTTPYFHNVTLCLRGSPAAGIILDQDF